MSPPSASPQRGGGYKRSSGGLLAALLVTVVAVTAFAGLRALILPDAAREQPSVDWEAQVRAGQSDGKLQIAAPETLPEDWRATTAVYTTGSDPSWQLGLLTGDESYVGVYERVATVEDLVEEHVDEDAEQGDDVEIAGETWQVWTDRSGDYAVTRELREPVGERGALLVVGDAEESEVRDLAASLVLRGE